MSRYLNYSATLTSSVITILSIGGAEKLIFPLKLTHYYFLFLIKETFSTLEELGVTIVTLISMTGKFFWEFKSNSIIIYEQNSFVKEYKKINNFYATKSEYSSKVHIAVANTFQKYFSETIFYLQGWK